MDAVNLEDKLNEIVRELGGSKSPEGEKLAMLAREAKENNQRLQASMDSLQDSLDYLRVCIKYQLFDLEATRRENGDLRRQLEEREN